MVEFSLRPYHPVDFVSLYKICLQTGDNGKDASAQYQDPELLGHAFAAPYAVFEPDLCFVLLRKGTPCGYILGTSDTQSFKDRCERDWFPLLRVRYPFPDENDTSPDAGVVRFIHQGISFPEGLEAYPAHLHIDLLPEAQGQGWGRRMIETFNILLMGMGVPGVHLGVSKENVNALAFYEKVGFTIIKDPGSYLVLGMKLIKR